MVVNESTIGVGEEGSGQKGREREREEKIGRGREGGREGGMKKGTISNCCTLLCRK